jgi:hypothetical protein
MDQGQHYALFETNMVLKQPHTNFQRHLRLLRINYKVTNQEEMILLVVINQSRE